MTQLEPSPKGKSSSQPKDLYWRSAADLEGSPEFLEALHREFPDGVADGPGLSDPVSRRKFLGVVAASAALTTMASCRKPKQKILTYNQRPEGLMPGIPQHYATALDVGGQGVGVLVRSNDGRPTKIEGNPSHPASLGGTTAQLQAEILNLYDPGRSRHVLKDGQPHAHDQADPDHHGEDTVEPYRLADFMAFWGRDGAQLQARGGEGVRFLLPPAASPSLQRMLQTVRSTWPSAVIHQWAPFARENEAAGSRMAYGSALETHYSLDQARVVVSFDRDFLGADADAIRSAKRFAVKRRPGADARDMSRVYVVESAFSITGGNADHRFRLAPSRVAAAVMALGAELGVGDAALQNALQPYASTEFQHKGKNWIRAVAKDLQANAGQSCVLAGAGQPPVVHAVVHAINQKLGNVGETVTHTAMDAAFDSGASTASLRDLVSAMTAGSVDTLVVLGGNPVYDAPADLDFAAGYAKVRSRIHLGLHQDETARTSTWHINAAHGLEAWGDLRAADGTAAIVQPLIAPLHGGCVGPRVRRAPARRRAERRLRDRSHDLARTGIGDRFRIVVGEGSPRWLDRRLGRRCRHAERDR